MLQARIRSGPVCAIWIGAIALMLALRLLTPAGLMPAFGPTGLIIVVCPDASAAGPATGHHGHHAPKKLHQPCPYAAASALGGLAAAFAPLILAALLFSAALPIGKAFLFIEHRRPGERPPMRGPPVPA